MELTAKEGNDSETVEIGSKEDEAETAERNKAKQAQATEELSARRISELGTADIGQETDSKDEKEEKTANWSPAPRTPGAFRIPEFRWSPQHYRILTELLDALEGDLHALGPVVFSTFYSRLTFFLNFYFSEVQLKKRIQNVLF